jgi:hypothetical protein
MSACAKSRILTSADRREAGDALPDSRLSTQAR